MNKKIAIIGCGRWGKNLIRCFHSLGALKGIFDMNPDAIKSFILQYDNLYGYKAIKEILVDYDIEGVVIATPVETHYKIAKLCLEHNKHIFVEKPITVNPHKAKELCNLARKKDLVFLSGHLLEYHPAIIKMRSMIYDNYIGPIKEIYSHRLNTGRVRQFENVWWSFAPHDVLLVINTIQSRINHISCFMSDYLKRGIADSTITTFKFENGCFSHIYVSWTHPFKRHSFVVIGTKGALEFTDSRQENKLIYYRNHFAKFDESFDIHKEGSEIIGYQNKEPLLEEAKDFLSCISNGSQPISSGQDGLQVVEILTQAIKNKTK